MKENNRLSEPEVGTGVMFNRILVVGYITKEAKTQRRIDT